MGIHVVARHAKRLVPTRCRPAAKRVWYGLLPERSRREALAGQLESQARLCGQHGSPLYASLLTSAAGDVRAAGPTWDLLRTVGPTALGSDDALALQLMGAVHRLVLEGELPDVAARYRSKDHEAAWPAFRTALTTHRERLAPLLRHAVQTNEVGRCPVLGSTFALVARETKLPLRLLEVGASAGLNLLFDRYRYEFPGCAWGDPSSPVRFTEPFAAGEPAFDGPIEIRERACCDLAPIDALSPEGQLTLQSYVWADQLDRIAQLRGAFAVFASAPVVVEQADAASWLERASLVQPGAATIVYHSFVMQFLDDASRRRFERALELAGARASSEAPLAWVRMEWAGTNAEIRLRTWPGDERLLATASPHGRDVHWLA
jgi:hypothetical protein